MKLKARITVGRNRSVNGLKDLYASYGCRSVIDLIEVIISSDSSRLAAVTMSEDELLKLDIPDEVRKHVAGIVGMGNEPRLFSIERLARRFEHFPEKVRNEINRICRDIVAAVKTGEMTAAA